MSAKGRRIAEIGQIIHDEASALRDRYGWDLGEMSGAMLISTFTFAKAAGWEDENWLAMAVGVQDNYPDNEKVKG